MRRLQQPAVPVPPPTSLPAVLLLCCAVDHHPPTAPFPLLRCAALMLGAAGYGHQAPNPDCALLQSCILAQVGAGLVVRGGGGRRSSVVLKSCILAPQPRWWRWPRCRPTVLHPARP